MSSNKLFVQNFRTNDLKDHSGSQIEFGKTWLDFLEIKDSLDNACINLVFKSLSKAHEDLNNKEIELKLAEVTGRGDRKTYANGSNSGHSALKEFFLYDLHLTKENNSEDYFAIYKASEFNYYLYYIPKLLHDNFIKFFESISPTVTVKRASDNTGNKRCLLQQIFYGAPGTGKSHKIKEDESVKEADKKKLVFRTTFHPDSDYSTFVGAYKPTMRPVADKYKAVAGKDEEITYSFVPQAFLQAYVAAWNNQEERVYLIIEEINRGNCAQIFGDLFQLLDRDDDGFSEYPIMADKDLATFLNGKDENGQDVLSNKDGIKDGKLRLPNNLYIWATMNTSDQSLFPIDSAFKRRWDWVYIPIDTKKENWHIKVGESRYSWTLFLEKINNDILTDETAEDKHLGFYFCKAENGEISQENFVGKVLFYLWNDVFKVYGIPAVIGSSKEWAYSKFYNPDGKVNEQKLVDLMAKLQIAPEASNTNTEDKVEDQ